MSQVVTLRLPDETAEEIRRIAQRERRSLSDVGARMIEEWVRQNRFAYIEFRSFNGERHACLKGRLQVWQVIRVAQDYGMDVEKTAAHLSLSPEQVQAALNYYETYPEEIEAAIAENQAMTYEQIKRLLPNAQLFEASLPHEETS
ncbi:MAG TPA: hypothetical protein VFB38_25700 [Chthonomonadaceae bacterium]|nr:hypothetical protein [Chthonomonadaceae bacterium]